MEFKKPEPDVMVHNCNSSTLEAEAKGSLV
jgi:hypothetical protein